MVGIVLFLALCVVTAVGGIQIITKAGYSPWWILLPLSLPVLWLVDIAVAFNGLSSAIGTYGAFDLQSIVAEAKVLSTLTFLDLLVNYAMFVVFAFSDWPVMQAARARHTPGPNPYRGGPASHGPAPGRPSPTTGPFAGVAPPPAAGTVVAPPPAVATAARPRGWHRVDKSEDEQYWDGRTWTARRRPSGGGDYVIIPLTG
jgi:hypothetical protein